jgi:hypothetical protein
MSCPKLPQKRKSDSFLLDGLTANPCGGSKVISERLSTMVTFAPAAPGMQFQVV